KNSVDPAWWEFFEDFGSENRAAGPTAPDDRAPAAPVTPASQRGEDASTGAAAPSQQPAAQASRTTAQAAASVSSGSAPSALADAAPATRAGGTAPLPPAPEPEPEPPIPAARHDGIQRQQAEPVPADLPKPP